MNGGWLPKRIVFGNLEGAVQRGRGGKEKEWADCVQGDIRAPGIAGDWKTTVLKAEVWVETVIEGGRRFMAGGGKKRLMWLDTTRRREKQRDWKTCYRARKRRILQSNTLDLVDKSKESLCGRETDRDLRSTCRCIA